MYAPTVDEHAPRLRVGGVRRIQALATSLGCGGEIVWIFTMTRTVPPLVSVLSACVAQAITDLATVLAVVGNCGRRGDLKMYSHSTHKLPMV